MHSNNQDVVGELCKVKQTPPFQHELALGTCKKTDFGISTELTANFIVDTDFEKEGEKTCFFEVTLVSFKLSF